MVFMSLFHGCWLTIDSYSRYIYHSCYCLCCWCIDIIYVLTAYLLTFDKIISLFMALLLFNFIFIDCVCVCVPGKRVNDIPGTVNGDINKYVYRNSEYIVLFTLTHFLHSFESMNYYYYYYSGIFSKSIQILPIWCGPFRAFILSIIWIRCHWFFDYELPWILNGMELNIEYCIRSMKIDETNFKHIFNIAYDIYYVD